MGLVTARRSALESVARTLARPVGPVLAVLLAAAPACSERKLAEDDQRGPDEGGAPGSGGSGGDGAGGTGGDGATGGASGGSGGKAGGTTGGSGGTGGDAAGGSGGMTGGSGGDETGGSGGNESGGSGGDGAGAGGATTGGSGGASGGSAGSGGSTGGSAGASAGPCETDALFLCDCVPSFGAATQTLDGAGDEFAAVPPMTFEVSALPYLSASYNASIPAEVTVRAAWSEDAFVAHVHVTDPLLLPDSSASLWNGDNVQLFLAGTAMLTGSYSGTEDGGATHLIVVPPTESTAARGITIYEPCYACVMQTALSTSVYAARAVADGWEVEFRVPWAATAEPRVSGTRIGFDLMFGVANTAGSGLELEGALKNDPTLSSASCSPTPFTHPGCDDRVWCTPRLE